jgi:hypothetical protein
MSTHEHRIQRLEYAEIQRECAKAVTDTAITVDQLLGECHRVFRLSDAEQREYFSNTYAALDAQASAALDAIRRRWATILRGVR